MAILRVARARMFRAAFRSAFARCPHDTQRNFSWLVRFAFSQWPHAAHVLDVLHGSTWTTGTPTSCALYERNATNCANDQPESLLRASLLQAGSRSRMPPRSSTAIP